MEVERDEKPQKNFYNPLEVFVLKKVVLIFDECRQDLEKSMGAYI